MHSSEHCLTMINNSCNKRAKHFISFYLYVCVISACTCLIGLYMSSARDRVWVWRRLSICARFLLNSAMRESTHYWQPTVVASSLMNVATACLCSTVTCDLVIRWCNEKFAYSSSFINIKSCFCLHSTKPAHSQSPVILFAPFGLYKSMSSNCICQLSHWQSIWLRNVVKQKKIRSVLASCFWPWGTCLHSPCRLHPPTSCTPACVCCWCQPAIAKGSHRKFAACKDISKL